MGLLDFFFSASYEDEEPTELDSDLLYPLAREWMGEASQSSDNDETDSYRWEAVEYAEEESGGGFWNWLTGG
jgi:hypothetical protein